MEDRADARRRLQMARELQQPRSSLHHPRRGGARGYPLWFREEELGRHTNGAPAIVSQRSLQRWSTERAQPSGVAGSKDKAGLAGIGLIILSIASIACPTASLDQMAMCAYAEGGGLHSRPLASQQLQQLQATR